MAEFILFGGTTEGREIAGYLSDSGRSAVVCVATDYGEALLTPTETVRVHTGRLDQSGIAGLIAAEKPKAVIDATHPYALVVSQSVKAACEAAGVNYLRVLRESVDDDGCLRFDSMDALVTWLNGTEGIIFSTLGAKEAAALAGVRDYTERVYLRVLPLMDSLTIAKNAGFPAKHLICMQGPFSAELNEAMFRAVGAAILLTKESGAAGGFPEKLEAARKCGMTVALLPRPNREDGLTLTEIRRRIEDRSL